MPGRGGISPAALRLVRRHRLWRALTPRDIHIGLDGYVRSSVRSTLEGNQAMESTITRGASGGCGQDPSSLPDD